MMYFTYAASTTPCFSKAHGVSMKPVSLFVYGFSQLSAQAREKAPRHSRGAFL